MKLNASIDPNDKRNLWALIMALILLPISAQAVCLNPFGCEPKTYGECINQAKEARTEVAAKHKFLNANGCRSTQKMNVMN